MSDHTALILETGIALTLLAAATFGLAYLCCSRFLEDTTC